MYKPQEISFGTGVYNADFNIDLNLHTWMIGQSGVGKSTAMMNAAIQLVQPKYDDDGKLIREGEGLTLIDPHGPAADKLLRYIPRPRMKDVILIDLRKGAVPGIIPQYKTKAEEELFKAFVLAMLRAIYHDRWGDETERILQGALDAVTEYYGFLNVPAVYLFLARDAFRTMLIDASKNPMMADFREQYDEKLRANEQMSRFSAPLNKWDELVRPTLRVLMSNERPIDWLRAMNEKKIIIVRVSKGEIGAAAAQMIGQMVVINEQMAGLRRKESDPKHDLVIDECQNFIGHVDFETFASEMRKYNIPLFLITQYLDHFPSLSALFGNFPNGVMYRVSGRDAKAIEDNFYIDGLSHQLVQLYNYNFVAARVTNNVPTVSGVIACHSKVKKLGNEPPPGAVIAESIRRYSPDPKKIEADTLKFLTPPVPKPKVLKSPKKKAPKVGTVRARKAAHL